MRRLLFIGVALIAAAAAAVAYQTTARDRAYRAFLAQGDAALHDEQTFVAIEAFSGAIALRPDSMLAHLKRGETYQRRAELDEAARDFRTAAELDPTATRPLEALGDALYQLRRFDRAADAYGLDLALDDRSAGVSYKLALTWYRAGNVDRALGTLDQTLRLDDRLADGHYLRGLCLREKRRNAEAIQSLEKAVALSPGLIAAREELADLYGASTRHADEIEQLQVLAGLDRDHTERQIAVGLAQARAGHSDLAVLTLGSALERTPNQPLIYRALGQVWLDVAEARNDRVALSKALEALGRVASDPGATSDILTLYGRALVLDGQFDVAERTFQQATTRFPVEPAAFTLYAAAAERQNHFDAARDALIEYSDLAPDDNLVPQATHIATLSLRLNDPRTAVTWLTRAASTSPNNIKLMTALAAAQLQAGDRDDAHATIARGLDKAPNDPTLTALGRRIH